MESLVGIVRDSFWRGKRVLITGHTGFKGGWLALWLNRLGAVVSGIALPPTTKPNLFDAAALGQVVDSHYCDIRDIHGLAERVSLIQPEIVFHLAAQPLVRASYADPVGTFATNVLGTVHMLNALRNLASVRVAVMVTTDKVYRNLEQVYPYREDDELGGHDPYSASKSASEMVIASYRDGFLAQQGVAVASARAGNVIGGGDWSADRLIPDAVRAWQAGQTLSIRSPYSTRPWQHVLEPLAGYLSLAEALWSHPELSGAYNFGPNPQDAASVRSVIELARNAYGRGEVVYCSESRALHEASMLALETAKVRRVLNVAPRWSLLEAVQRTMTWYCADYAGDDSRELCMADIDAYER